MKMYKHLMVDLETLGTTNNSVILSIGAVYFDIKTGETGKRLYVNIDIQSCLDVGLKIEGNTLNWWMDQSNDARNALKEDVFGLNHALFMFRSFFEQGTYIWGNSARFDLGILENAYKSIGIQTPWSFRNEMCLRTFAVLKPEIKREHIFIGTPHNAIDDCLNQIAVCSKVYNALSIEEL